MTEPYVPATAADAVKTISVAMATLAYIQAMGDLDAVQLAQASAEIETALVVIGRTIDAATVRLPVLTLGEVTARAGARRGATLSVVQGGVQ